MIPYPDFNPTIVSIGSLEIRWYGLFYVISFILGHIFLKKLYKKRNVILEKDQYENLLFIIMLGVIVGGRIGYILFYNLSYYISNPFHIFAVWEGGLSFHGGLIGIIFGGIVFCKKHNLSFYKLADPVIPLAPIGIGLVRWGNFMNAELYGRITDVPWAMKFPTDQTNQLRHPSQLYELFAEGVVLFAISYYLLKKKLQEGVVFWTFIGLYGFFRFLIEFTREPDAQLGFVFGPFTMGQILCFAMMISSLIGFIYLNKQKHAK